MVVGWGFLSLSSAEGSVEEVEDSSVLVGPAFCSAEGVVFDGVGGDRPVLLSEFDEPFD